MAIIGTSGNDVLNGTTLSDTILGLAGNDTINGDDNDDTLYGGAGYDTLDGGTGADYMEGGTEDDFYTVDDPNDVVVEVAGGGVDTVNASIDYTLGAELENLTLLGDGLHGVGNNKSNYILVESGDGEAIYGLEGDDILDDPNGGSSTLVGGSGNDSYYVWGNNDLVVEAAGGGNDTVHVFDSGPYTLAAEVENLELSGLAHEGIGNAKNNVMSAFRGQNRLEGLAGNDTLSGGDEGDELYGGDGNDFLDGLSDGAIDTLVGGIGNDTYMVYDEFNHDFDVVVEVAGGGLDTVKAWGIDYTLGTEVESLTLMDTAVSGTGNDKNNSILGNGGDNVLSGLAGSDLLEGGAGADTLDGGVGTDKASYATATAGVTVNLGLTTAQNTIGAGTDRLISIENLKGSDFNDTLMGNAGSNLLIGGLGKDIMNGGAGTDTASYETATTGVIVNLGLTTAQNTVGAGIDTLSNFENVKGSNFNDTLTGSAGNNVLSGLGNNDTLNGGLGNDQLNGGSGQDKFVFNTALNATTNKDTITDFSVVDDTILLENAIFTKFTATGAIPAGTFKSGAGAVAGDSNDYLIYNTTTGTLSYDADGNGAGAAVAFVTLLGNPALTSTDFTII